MVVGEHPELFADNLATASADSGINFVENERRGGVGGGQDGFEGQHEARGFATGGDSGERLERLARVGSDEKLHAVYPSQVTGIVLFGLVVYAGRNAVFVGKLFELDGETRAFHVEVVQLFFHGNGE